QPQRHVFDCLDDRLAGPTERHRKVFDINDWLCHTLLRVADRPSRVAPAAIATMARPGKTVNHQARCKYVRPFASMAPHSGDGGGVPRPRKDKADAQITAWPIPSVISASRVDSVLGMRWLRTFCHV